MSPTESADPDEPVVCRDCGDTYDSDPALEYLCIVCGATAGEYCEPEPGDTIDPAQGRPIHAPRDHLALYKSEGYDPCSDRFYGHDFQTPAESGGDRG